MLLSDNIHLKCECHSFVKLSYSILLISLLVSLYFISSFFFSSYQTSFDSWNRQKCHLFNLNKIDILEIKYHAFLKNLYFFCWRLNVIEQSNILQESSHHPILVVISLFYISVRMCWFKFCLLPDSEPFQKPLGLQYRTRGWFRSTKNEQTNTLSCNKT